MGIIDVIIIIFAAFYFIKGYRQGLFLSMIKVIAYLLGILISVHFSSHLSSLLFNEGSAGILVKTFPIISYTILFVGVVFSVHLLGKWINRALKLPILSPINKIAGGILYLAIFTLIASFFLWIAQKIQILNMESINESLIISILTPLAPSFLHYSSYILPILQESYNDLNSFFENWPLQYSQ